MALAEEVVKAGPGTVGIDVGSEEVHEGYVDRELAAVLMVAATVLVAVAMVVGVPRLGSRRRASIRLMVGIAAYGEDWLMVGRLWDWRRRMWRALAGCCRLIGGGGYRGLKRAEAHSRMVCGCEGRWVGIEVAIAGMVVLGWHMKRVERCFGVGIVVWGFVILLDLSVTLRAN